MRERNSSLIGAGLAVILLASVPARGQMDAATRAQEGDINHWIEYYRKNREPAAAPAATPPVTRAPQGAAEKEGQRERSGTEEPKKP